jgi:predicted N-acyltransferase
MVILPNSVSPTAGLSVEFLSSLADISASEWDGLAGIDYPFTQHKFLWGLEKTGCANTESGWQPCHAVLREGSRAIAIMPLYLKSHSYGEYVFDWSWADAWRKAGLNYYPKLVSAIPFTPATGPRICVAPGCDPAIANQAMLRGVRQFADRENISSWHLLFPDEALAGQLAEEGSHLRVASQFHWFNNDYVDFEDFLATFTSRKRKSLKRERRRVVEQGLTLQTLVGADIGEEQWSLFYRFYQLTYAKRSGHGGYLSREFFTETAAGMGSQVIMVLAYLGREAVAGALYFRSDDTLFGRYWGAEHEFDCLHFEACYYQGIEYCIANGLQRFDPGAQGEHKIQRGFRPVKTYSNHWIADPRFSAAINAFTREEQAHIDHYMERAAHLLPFKTSRESS